MRRSILKKTHEGKKKRNQMIIGVVLIALISFSIFSYSMNMQERESKEKIIYDGIEFIDQNGFWITSIGDLNLVFRNNPKDLEDLDYEKELGASISYTNKPLYLETEDTLSTSEIYNNLNQIVERMQNACLNEEDCEGDLPIKDCSNNFIIIKESNSSLIRQEENCIFIKGKLEDLVKLTDEYLFRIFGIKQ